MEFLLLLQASNANVIVAYHTSNRRLAIEIGWWSIILIFKDKILCELYSKNVVENDAHFVLKCPLYNSTRFPSLSEGHFILEAGLRTGPNSQNVGQ